MPVTSFFLFSHNVFVRLLFQGLKKLGLCGKGLTLSHIIPTFNDPKGEGFGKHSGKTRQCW